MLFSSLEFLYLYIPVVLVAYFCSPHRWRNIVLFAVSLVFYGWGEPTYVFLMLATIAIDYAAGYFIERASGDQKTQKGILISTVIVNLGILFVFKYLGFIVDTLRMIPALSDLPRIELALPIGISFYTFQALSYVIDVYRRDVSAQKNFVNFGAYVTLFPQLIAGPIVRYKDVDDQLTKREHSVALAVSGIRTFSCGLAKKVLLANAAGEMWRNIATIPEGEQTFLGAWLGLVFFGFQIYFDFSGYSDMAIGLGRIFGFKFLENFNYPFISKSVSEFWRRWHISLSTWFREYVYIPLGGSRGSAAHTYFNIFVVWLLTGLWHGASWNYVLWGLYFCVLLILERAFLGKILEKIPSIFAHLYTLIMIQISWFIFVFDGSEAYLGVSNALVYLRSMFGVGVPFANGSLAYETVRNVFLLAVMVIASVSTPRKKFYELMKKSVWAEHAANALAFVSLVVCTAYLVNSGFNPFLYFRF